MKRGAVRIGTSGWMYKDWSGEFYPSGMKKGFLSHLSAEFPTVEVNSSFYHLPLASTFAKWREQTPDGFVFAVKLSRYITHQKKLEGTKENLARFFVRAKALKEKLGPILIQLPPWHRFEEARVRAFLKDLKGARRALGRSARFALEPRHASWVEETNAKRVRTLLRKERIAIVFPDSRKIPSFLPVRANVTADFVYVRFHGPSEFAASRYGARRLSPWAKRFAAWSRAGIDCFAYFNNDVHGHAIHDARTLTRQMKRLGKASAKVSVLATMDAWATSSPS